MIISLSEKCSIFDQANEYHLHRFLQTATGMGWHTIATPAPERLKEVLPAHVWRLYGEYLQQAWKTLINSPQRWVNHPDCAACDPAKLAEYYNQPYVLLLENQYTDGRWIKAIIKRLRPRLAYAFAQIHPRLSIQQAGGIGEIPKVLREIARDYERSRPGGLAPLCIMTIADSDAKRPGAISEQARQVTRVAEELGVASHILHKRSIENYVPDDALLAYSSVRTERRDASEFIVSLPAVARDHYPMKAGLSVRDVEEFSDVYPTETPVGIKLGDFISDLLENFEHLLNAAALRERDGSEELEEILDKLERNL